MGWTGSVKRGCFMFIYSSTDITVTIVIKTSASITGILPIISSCRSCCFNLSIKCLRKFANLKILRQLLPADILLHKPECVFVFKTPDQVLLHLCRKTSFRFFKR